MQGDLQARALRPQIIFDLIALDIGESKRTRPMFGEKPRTSAIMAMFNEAVRTSSCLHSRFVLETAKFGHLGGIADSGKNHRLWAVVRNELPIMRGTEFQVARIPDGSKISQII